MIADGRIGIVGSSVGTIGMAGIREDVDSFTVDVIFISLLLLLLLLLSFLDRKLFTMVCKVSASMLRTRKYLKSFIIRGFTVMDYDDSSDDSNDDDDGDDDDDDDDALYILMMLIMMITIL